LQWLKRYVRRAELSKNALEKFCHNFDAFTEPSNRKFHRLNKLPIQFWTDDPALAPDFAYKHRIDTVEGVAIHIPIHKLDDFLSTVDDRKYKEMEIRANVPAVKLAYERYQMLLKMCGGDYDAGY